MKLVTIRHGENKSIIDMVESQVLRLKKLRKKNTDKFNDLPVVNKEI
jgi:hypothetical protein